MDVSSDVVMNVSWWSGSASVDLGPSRPSRPYLGRISAVSRLHLGTSAESSLRSALSPSRTYGEKKYTSETGTNADVLEVVAEPHHGQSLVEPLRLLG